MATDGAGEPRPVAIRGGLPPLDAPRPTDLGNGTRENPRLVVESWLVHVADPAAPRYLMLERAPKDGGFWQGVSGCVEPEDQTLADAMRREIHEETGLDASDWPLRDLQSQLDFTGFVSGAWFRKRTMALRVPDDLDLTAIRLTDEHVAVRLMTEDEALAATPFAENRADLRDLAARLLAGTLALG